MGPAENNLPRWLRVALVGRKPKWTLVRILAFVAVIFVARACIILPVRVSGPSMLPTYPTGGVNFVNRLAYRRADPRRGDIVAIRYSGQHVMMMKRIVGLPGETIAFRDSLAFINGRPLDEPYVKFPGSWQLAPETLESNQFFVVGDNRSVSVYGKTTRDRIVGKIILCKNLFAPSSSSH